MRVHEGKMDATGLKFGVVVSRFNDFITRRLLEGCLDALVRHGAAEDDIEVAYVPGCFEIRSRLGRWLRAASSTPWSPSAP